MREVYCRDSYSLARLAQNGRVIKMMTLFTSAASDLQTRLLWNGSREDVEDVDDVTTEFAERAVRFEARNQSKPQAPYVRY